MHAKVFDPGDPPTSSHSEVFLLTSTLNEGVVLPVFAISGLNPFSLSVSGLHAGRPTLKVEGYPPSSKGLATWWLARPSRAGIAPVRLHDLARSLRSSAFIRVPKNTLTNLKSEGAPGDAAARIVALESYTRAGGRRPMALRL